MTTCSVPEAARLLKVHEQTVLDLVHAYKIPAAKIGRAWVMLERDVLEYLELQIQMQTAARMGRILPQVGRGRRFTAGVARLVRP